MRGVASDACQRVLCLGGEKAEEGGKVGDDKRGLVVIHSGRKQWLWLSVERARMWAAVAGPRGAG